MAQGLYVQLQQDPVRVAINKTLLALLLQVCLEGADGLGVVSFQAIYYLDDLGRPFLWIFGVDVVVAHDGQPFWWVWICGGGPRTRSEKEERGRVGMTTVTVERGRLVRTKEGRAVL